MTECKEIKKPVVPQYVADWYEDYKNQFEENLFDICVQIRDCTFEDKLSAWFNHLPNKPIETLVNMHQFGYEVENEKLYTAMLLLTGGYLNYNDNLKMLSIVNAPHKTAKEVKAYHFTKRTLIKYKVWKNDNYFVDEVKE